MDAEARAEALAAVRVAGEEIVAARVAVRVARARLAAAVAALEAAEGVMAG